MLPKRAAIQHYWPASSSAHIAGRRCRPFCINVLPFSLHGFPAPSRRRFQALPCGVIAGYPMQTVFLFSRFSAGFGNKKSPHNNLNLTIPSGMALVRVCYVAIRKLKTCSAALRKRELLGTRHFRQCARKNNENFGKKREGWTVPALLTRKNTRLFIMIKL